VNSPVLAINHRTIKAALLSVALMITSIVLFSAPAHAKKSCGVYQVTIGNKVFSGKQTTVVPAGPLANKIAHIQGQYTDFYLDLNTFTVLNYKLVKANTQVFDSKTPVVAGSLNSPMVLKLNNEQMVLERNNDTSDMKIQAKDCDNGGTFQMETDRPGQETNKLAQGINYCLQDSVSGKLFFTNGPLLGYDSPQLATLVNWTSDKATWSLEAGGRIGMVTGEDAEEALATTGNSAACGR